MNIVDVLLNLLKTQPWFMLGGLFVIFGALVSVLIWPLGALMVLLGVGALIVNLLKPKK